MVTVASKKMLYVVFVHNIESFSFCVHNIIYLVLSGDKYIFIYFFYNR